MVASLAACAVGVWLLAAPDLLGASGAAEANERITGALAASIGAMAASEVLRGLRWGNALLGAWLILSSLLLKADHVVFHDMACGVALVGLAMVRGRTRHRWGGGWKAIWGRGAP